jgi:hypothetical protein
LSIEGLVKTCDAIGKFSCVGLDEEAEVILLTIDLNL